MGRRFDYRTEYKTMSKAKLEARVEYLWERWIKDIFGKDEKLQRELDYARRKLENAKSREEYHV